MRILFVCTGNTCRSPMAEALLRKLAKERGLPLEVSSAGVAATEGIPISRHAEAILRDHNIDDVITSQALRIDVVHESDLILTLTQSHKQHVLRIFPEVVGKIYTLKEYAEDDEQVLRDIDELDSLYATLTMNRALGKPVEHQDQERLFEIQQRIPSFDVSDPFGGSRADYDVAATEIRTAIDRIVVKLADQRN
ncbi:low molecular weight protein arginine phosphatase [Paenibacillus sp. FA6]|uniref:low molecular weight protein arginine phosphatase n=1 Tax=Paenibacillus sp. FA6 TaxID=3413029 RepID=UPI003F65B446